jgi:DNA-binding transcriptional regulator YhcF (GntR family)
MADVLIINAATGERIERDFTEEELVQRAADQAAFEEAEAARIAEEEAKATAKASALAKLAALGLTEEEAAAIVGA